jgi:hypothetical protein
MTTYIKTVSGHKGISTPYSGVLVDIGSSYIQVTNDKIITLIMMKKDYPAKYYPHWADAFLALERFDEADVEYKVVDASEWVAVLSKVENGLEKLLEPLGVKVILTD